MGTMVLLEKMIMGKPRRIFLARNRYVNRQLESRGFAPIPFSRHRYFRRLVADLFQEGKLDRGDCVVVYGTESSGLYMTHVLQEYGAEIYGYADSAEDRQGHVFLGKQIYAPAELKGIRNEIKTIIIASSAGEAIGKTLCGLSMQEGKDFYRLPI